MFISNVSKEQWATYCQITANVCTVSSGVTTIAFAILGRDYTYPATVTILGAFASVSFLLAKTPQQDKVNQKSENKTEGSKESDSSTTKGCEEMLDKTGEIFKRNLKNASNEAVGISTDASTTGIKSMLGNNFGSLSEPASKLLGESAKGLLNKSTDSSVDYVVKLTKESLSNSKEKKKEN